MIAFDQLRPVVRDPFQQQDHHVPWTRISPYPRLAKAGCSDARLVDLHEHDRVRQTMKVDGSAFGTAP